ncbi:sensor histidine kinase [Pedosphaera parvula]|uniref:histidine kinase n=1 Tax=Pedosphaera parvula (strain Ellin514) TaxID=320771 RepID=B9XHS2_PEDPL|nr:ATP-binding protein [Pedosphaera parvula]EEF60650.1 multi-sensor signal transduction histidine kinase [Pedosphaera parvula Ellin514]
MKAGFAIPREGVQWSARFWSLWEALRPYVVAVLSVVLITALRVALAPILGDRFVYIAYFAGIAATAWFGGWGASLFCTILSFLAADWFFIPPTYHLNLLEFHSVDWIGLLEFSVVGMVITAFSQTAKRGRRRAEASTRIAEEKGKALEAEIGQRKRAEEALVQSEKRLQLALESAHMVGWDWDLARDEITLSPNAKRVFGIRAPSVIKGVNSAFTWIHSEDLEGYRRQLLEALEKRKKYVTRFRIVRSDNGKVIWLEDHGGVVCEAEGKPVRVGGVVVDVTERKRAEEMTEFSTKELEQQVEERTARYVAINRELDSFNYSVSHDLRAPLRAIFSFTQLLSEEYGKDLDAQGREYLQFVIQGAARMNQTVEDLLALARLTQRELQLKHVDLSALAWTVVEEMRCREPAREVHFEILPTPAAYGDPRLMRVVLEHLFSNAWKFTAKRPGARIEFGAMLQEDECVYFVKDNGVGFDMESSKLLFGPFQRLHAAEEFPGTGIGLATVNRIITRHGGRIWAQGEKGKGAVFYFALPCEDAAPGQQLYQMPKFTKWIKGPE